MCACVIYPHIDQQSFTRTQVCIVRACSYPNSHSHSRNFFFHSTNNVEVTFGAAARCTAAAPAWLDPRFERGDIGCTPAHADSAWHAEAATPVGQQVSAFLRRQLLSTQQLANDFFFKSPIRGTSRLLVRFACDDCRLKFFLARSP